MFISQSWKCTDFAMLANARSMPAYTFASNSVSLQVAVLKISRRAAQNRFVTAIRAIGRFIIGVLNQQGRESLEFSARLWSDSTIALNWKISPSWRWSMFVANRVGEIQRLTKVERWRSTYRIPRQHCRG